MWEIRTTDTFDEWLDALDDTDRENVVAAMIVLRAKGPMLSRPYADTVNGSAHKNMKELRVQSKGNPIRAFFAFDPSRTGILLCAGEKTGKDKSFYEEMISVADREFKAHLEKLRER
ncbi:diaminopimelate decarboxylase [Pseudidiomarina aestuarii]|uniref:Diaminopimelate decarboxylase n=1 Tax=Pseudidiomarina aestuarii TaxID=624146 RepID=A0A6N4DF22_9GAMM|nr:diaminopimelate decarboxylase [Pseudidiomarina aestuarii]PTC00346.1 diaminopimelate decarboxylase [Thalassospira xiamenensis]